MSEILVTGGSGFIGSHLVAALRAAGRDVVAPGHDAGDVGDQATWRAYSPAPVVIHLAGRTFVPASWDDPAGFVQCNLLGTVGALDYCVRNRARLVYVSSYLYGRPDALPITEAAPLRANTPYALSKKLAEDACRFYAESAGVDITVLRPFNVYGTGQSDQFLVPSIIRQVTRGERIRVKDLEPRRDYVFIDDVVSAMVAAMSGTTGFNVFNIGTGVSHSVGELIAMVQRAAGTRLPVDSAGERRKDEVMDTVADIAMAREHLGWRPKWSLAAGIQAMIDKA